MKEEIYVFFDIDGTLLPEGDSDIPQNTIDSINKLSENGVEVFICTGRGYFQAQKYIEQIGAKSFITSNGQEAYFRGEEVYTYNLSLKEITYLKEKFSKNNIFWGFETRGGIKLQEGIKNIELVKRKIEGYGLLEVGIGNIDDFSKIKQMWAFGTKEELNDFENEIIDRFKFFRWSDDSIEIVPLEESKGKAVSKVVKNNKNVKTYAFGDGYNDIELLTTVNVGVAMGNAKEEIKVVADYITDDCDKDGITKALKHFGLIG